MVESKLVKVKDEGTEMVFLVTKFDLGDCAFLDRAGWEITDGLCVVTALGNEARSVIGTFKYPHYDIPERTGKLGFNHTTAGVVEAISEMIFEDIPMMIDARDHEKWMKNER